MFVVSVIAYDMRHMKFRKPHFLTNTEVSRQISDVDFGIFCVGYKGLNSLAIFLCQLSVEYKYSFKINFTKFLYHSYHNSKKNSFSILLHPLKLLKLN